MSDRKYRQRGYQDEGPRERRPQGAQGPKKPLEPRDPRMPRDPHVPRVVRFWKSVLRPFGFVAVLGAVVGAIGHFFAVGPKETKEP